jgi:predicted O-methyltransferase YrrM
MPIEYAGLGVLVLVGLVVLRKLVRYKSLYPLLPRKYNFGKRRDTLTATLSLLKARGARILIETGTARLGLAKTKGDGASTIVFGLWAKQNDAHLHSVDIDARAINESRRAALEVGLSASVSFHVSDSVQFLADFSQPVDFLYLDSYDYDRRDESVQKASQAHHMKEFAAIESRLHAESVVLIDDCGAPGGGKGKLVIEHMLANGWLIVMDRYQVLLTRASPSAGDQIGHE